MLNHARFRPIVFESSHSSCSSVTMRTKTSVRCLCSSFYKQTEVIKQCRRLNGMPKYLPQTLLSTDSSVQRLLLLLLSPERRFLRLFRLVRPHRRALSIARDTCSMTPAEPVCARRVCSDNHGFA